MFQEERILLLRKVAILSLSLILLLAGCQETGPFVPRDPHLLRGEGRLYLVGLGDFFPRSLLEKLAAHYKDKYGLTIEILPPIRLEPSAIDAARDQLVAERAVDLLKKGFRPRRAADEKSILIALTQKDMYIRHVPQWGWAFSYRDGEACAVVSVARMTLGLTSADSDRFETRIRKMLSKNIGTLYYRLPVSSHPQSVLYSGVGGIEELDYMGEDF
jgi:predicted Zn-dependent protease